MLGLSPPDLGLTRTKIHDVYTCLLFLCDSRTNQGVILVPFWTQDFQSCPASTFLRTHPPEKWLCDWYRWLPLAIDFWRTAKTFPVEGQRCGSAPCNALAGSIHELVRSHGLNRLFSLRLGRCLLKRGEASPTYVFKSRKRKRKESMSHPTYVCGILATVSSCVHW